MESTWIRVSHPKPVAVDRRIIQRDKGAYEGLERALDLCNIRGNITQSHPGPLSRKGTNP